MKNFIKHILRAAICFFISFNSFSQDSIPLKRPATPNTVDAQGRKQGFWVVGQTGYAGDIVEYYHNDIALWQYCYYSDKDIAYSCRMIDRMLEGEFTYYNDGNVVQIVWVVHNNTDYPKSLEIITKKLEEETKAHGKESTQRGMWLINAAVVVDKLGRYKDAENMYLESFQIRNHLKTDTLGLVSSTEALVDFYMEKEMYNKVLQYAPELSALKNYKIFNGDRDLTYEQTMSKCYLKLGRTDSAKVLRQFLFDSYKKTAERDTVHFDYEYINYYDSWFKLASIKDDSAMIENMITDAARVWDRKSDSYNNFILDRAFSFYRDRENYKRATEIIDEAALLVAQRPNNTWYTAWMPDRATVYYLQKKYDLSEKVYLEIFSIYDKKALSKYDGNYLSCLWEIAEVYNQWGKPSKAKYYYSAALELAKNDYKPNYVEALKRYGNYLITRGAVDEGEALLLDALSNVSSYETEDSPTYLSILNSMGSSYQSAGLPAKAETVYLRVLDAYGRNYGTDHLYYADMLSTLGKLYTEIGLYDKARDFLDRALWSYKKAYGYESMKVAGIYNRKGSVEMEEYEHHSEKKYLKEMEHNYFSYFELVKKLKGTQSSSYAVALNQVGLFDLYKGSYSKAEYEFKKAIGLYDSLKIEKGDSYDAFLHNLALTHHHMGKQKLADKEFETCIGQREKTSGKTSDVLATTYHVYGKCLWQEQDWNNAQSYLDKALQIRKKKLEDLAFLTETERELFWNNFSRDVDLYKSFLVEDIGHQSKAPETLTNLTLNIKGKLLQANTKWKNKMQQSKDSTVVAAFEEWEIVKSVLSKASMSGSDKKYVDSLNARLTLLEKTLTEKTAYFGKVKPEAQYTWQDVQKKLKKNEAAVEIVRVKKYGYPEWLTDSSDSRLPRYPSFGSTDTVYYTALIIRPGSKKPEAVVMKKGKEMERYEKYYHNMIKFQEKDTLTYTIFWKPIEEKLKNINRVYFSGDGLYNTINLNTLFNPENGKYLLEEKEIINLTTTRDIILADIGKSTHKYAVLMGMPSYKLSKEEKPINIPDSKKMYYELAQNTTRGSEGLVQLPGTKKEVEEIENVLQENNWTTSVYLEQEAREETIKNSANPTVLHIATHGFFLPDKNTNGNVSPLVKSGLMLAGAENTLNEKRERNTIKKSIGEDGILTAYEAMSLDLDSTELVVLSACETGLGEQRNGEGVYGLQRAFRVAGAKSIIMSLWKVNDRATEELMNNFYKEWTSGKDMATAFKNAQLKVKLKFPDPIYWGGFILVGKNF
ncbi:MAG TPA: CHAT domain-containing tetratricopeptide repeat protein [Cytophagaceae bacterium]|nr:CHAT domain-containing tetratricopeptide repeat protein [Cytophagaceae bacterium]